MFRLAILALMMCFLSCSKKTNINGSWYVGWFNKQPLDSLTASNSYDNFNYEELYFTEDKIITVSNISGSYFLSNYKIKKDSFFSGLGDLDIEYRGLVKNLKQNSFIFTNNIDSIFYYKLTGENIFDDYVDGNNFQNLNLDSTFYQSFLNRSFRLHEKMKVNLRKQLNE